MAQKSSFLVLCWVLFVFVGACFGVDLDVKATNQSTVVDMKGSVTLNDSSIVTTPVVVADKEVKSDVQDKVVNQKVVKDDDPAKSNLSKEVDSKKDPVEVLATNTNDSSKEVGEKKKKDEKEQGDVEKSDAEKGIKKEHKDGDSKPTRKDTARGEECDPSNMCKDEKSGLIACLRVPGNDSPDYSLLIQNKGTTPLSINIAAPKYVRLEESTIKLLQKEDKKVKVTIGEGDNNTSIILSAGNGQCNLDFHDLVSHNSETQTSNSKKFSYTDLSSRASSILYISLAAMFLVGSVTLCVKLRKRGTLSGELPKYQKLEMELPITNTAIMTKVSPEVVADGWDNSWGDDSWDDEEAPKTPTLPLTPSLSSKGLAARRSSKEGWKD
ncbi:hypothetical protein C5167_047623 [Papaver somniferum]|uniref:DUF7356 domain-containing protein n=1 Tax=Papaver somniferum TaxID=3469 RepID=A0A4Y7LK39_PAPSO|nr:uncharacterized protein LOC113320093 [Papaver somniferum]RZC84838.1 hypothetical protein C5167_047623 [Papaver somniferum]